MAEVVADPGTLVATAVTVVVDTGTLRVHLVHHLKRRCALLPTVECVLPARHQDQL